MFSGVTSRGCVVVFWLLSTFYFHPQLFPDGVKVLRYCSTIPTARSTSYVFPVCFTIGPEMHLHRVFDSLNVYWLFFTNLHHSPVSWLVQFVQRNRSRYSTTFDVLVPQHKTRCPSFGTSLSIFHSAKL